MDGIAMSALFNAVVLVGFTLWPQEYSVMFPKEIKNAAAPYVNKKETRKMKLWLPGKVRNRIKGTEHCKAWERKEWLLKLAIPEHALGWTFLVCPIAGLIVAGIAALLV